VEVLALAFKSRKPLAWDRVQYKYREGHYKSGARVWKHTSLPQRPNPLQDSCFCDTWWQTDPNTGELTMETCDVCRAEKEAKANGIYVLSYVDRHGMLRKYHFVDWTVGHAFRRVFEDRASVARDLRARILEAAFLDFSVDEIIKGTESQRCRMAARVVNVPSQRVRSIYRRAIAEIRRLYQQPLTGKEQRGQWPWVFLNSKQRSFFILRSKENANDQKLLRLTRLLTPLPYPAQRLLSNDLEKVLISARENLLRGEKTERVEILRIALNGFKPGFGDSLMNVNKLAPLLEALLDPKLRFAT